MREFASATRATPAAGASFLVQRGSCGNGTRAAGELREKFREKEAVSLQPKLIVGAPGDPYEREADAAAKAVSEGRAAAVSAGPVAQVNRRADRSAGSNMAAPASVSRAISGPGESLGRTERAFFEPRFGHNFGNVRIHRDTAAANSAREIAARAYTVGNHVVFGAGSYAPESRAGRNLIAHELSHAVQQGAAPALGGPRPVRLTAMAEPRVQMRSWREGEMPPMGGPEFRAAVIAEAVDLVSEAAPTLGPALRRVLEGDPEIESVANVLDEGQRRAGGMRYVQQADFVTQTAERALQTFILDPQSSSLDLLPENQRRRFRDFNWEEHDFPGGPAGSNEERARSMSSRLSDIRPERRANATAAAVVRRAEFTERVQRHIRGALVAIPDFTQPADGSTVPNQPAGHRLYRTAQESFLEMRADALEDGVPLVVESSYRAPAVSRRRAAAADNPAAVASFSAHNLGLAVDLRMSMSYVDPGGQRRDLSYQETTTTPMQNVVDMRESPVHKWMFLHGAGYGWFPYQNEPWHWEYNPEGFRDQFNENVQMGAEAREAADEEQPPPE